MVAGATQVLTSSACIRHEDEPRLQLVAEASRGRPTATGTPSARRGRRRGSLAYLFVVPAGASPTRSV